MDKIKILLIDDNIRFITNVCRYLNLVAPEYQVYTTGTGEDGIKIIEKEKPDILVCDLFMLDIDGDEVIEKAKTISPNTRLIIITAYTDEKTEERLKKIGIDDIIYKPIEDIENLVSLIRRVSSKL